MPQSLLEAIFAVPSLADKRSFAMTWRFRKIFQSGPLRWTWTKKGVGWSIGIPGLRYGISPNGSRYISFGIPGTGLYFIKYLDKGKQQPTAQPPKPQPPVQPPQQIPPQQSKPSTAAKPSEPWWKEWKRKP
jgi:hypothetical protein